MSRSTTPTTWPDAAPPMVARKPMARTVHGTRLEDDYAWLRAANWRDVLRDPSGLPDDIRAVLDAENAYAARHLDPLADLVATLKSEMRGRIKEDDSSVPLPDGPWLYHRSYRDGGQHPQLCRAPRDGGAEELLLDGDREADGHAFFALGDIAHAPDHSRLAWSADAQGSELYTIRVRDLASGADLDDCVSDTRGDIVWRADARAFYYVRVDENHRTAQVFLHELGGNADRLVFEETDPAWFVDIDRTASGAFAVISVTDHSASECHLVDLADPHAVPRCVEPRAPERRYSVAHRGDELFIRTNADGAEDFKVVRAPLAAPGKANWIDFVSHRRGRMIVAMSVFPDHLVRLERENGLPRLVVRGFDDGAEHVVDFAQEAYSLGLEGRLAFASTTSCASPIRFDDDAARDLGLQSRDRTSGGLRKRQVDPERSRARHAYVTRRLFADALPTAQRVPITVLHRAGLSRSMGQRRCCSTATAPTAIRFSAGFSAPTRCRWSIAASSTRWRMCAAAPTRAGTGISTASSPGSRTRSATSSPWRGG